MALDRVWAIKSFTFDGTTYDETNGGPVDWDFDDAIQEVGDRCAGETYPTILLPEGDLSVIIVMRDPYQGLDTGTTDTLAITLKKGDGTSDETISFANMVYLGESGSFRKSIPGATTIRFRHSSQFGTGRITRA